MRYICSEIVAMLMFMMAYTERCYKLHVKQAAIQNSGLMAERGKLDADIVDNSYPDFGISNGILVR